MAKGARATRNGKRRVPRRSKRKATATKATPRRSAGRPVKASPAAAAIAAGVIAPPKPFRFQPTFATRTASLTVRAGAGPKAQTIIYVHGIANKPSVGAEMPMGHALFGAGLGDRSRMAYWVNRDYYPQPEDDDLRDRPDHCRVDDEGSPPARHGARQGRRRRTRSTRSSRRSRRSPRTLRRRSSCARSPTKLRDAGVPAGGSPLRMCAEDVAAAAMGARSPRAAA